MRWNAVKKKIIFTAFFLHLFAVNAVNRGELFIFTAFSVFLQKKLQYTGFETLTSCMSSTPYSTAPNFTYFNDISCEFKSGFSKRWKANAVNFCKKCGDFFKEIRWISRWILVRNAVSLFFTAFTAITAFLTKIHPKPRPGLLTQLTPK